jgi:heat shock protein HtpX
VSSIAATLAGAITMLAQMAQWAALFGGFGGQQDEGEQGPGLIGGLLLMILAPIAAMVIQLAISRAREYGADATGAHLYGDPEPLARALEKLEWANTRVTAPANPATAHLYIVNPLRGASLAGLFSTHPPSAERIRRLRAMRGGLARPRAA